MQINIKDDIIYRGIETRNGIKCARFEILPGKYNFAVANDAPNILLKNGITQQPKSLESMKLIEITE